MGTRPLETVESEQLQPWAQIQQAGYSPNILPIAHAYLPITNHRTTCESSEGYALGGVSTASNLDTRIPSQSFLVAWLFEFGVHITAYTCYHCWSGRGGRVKVLQKVHGGVLISFSAAVYSVFPHFIPSPPVIFDVVSVYS